MASGVYGASEGLKVAVLDSEAPGGQAGTSSRIENYLGFPVGLSGSDLARRGVAQARKFGAEFITPQQVVEVGIKDNYKLIKLDGGAELTAHALVVATGVQYRKLEVAGMDTLTGAGVYYGSSIAEAVACDRGRRLYRRRRQLGGASGALPLGVCQERHAFSARGGFGVQDVAVSRHPHLRRRDHSRLAQQRSRRGSRHLSLRGYHRRIVAAISSKNRPRPCSSLSARHPQPSG